MNFSKIALPPTPMNGDSNGNQEAVFPTSATDGIALPPPTECQRLKVFIAIISNVPRHCHALVTHFTFQTSQSITQIYMIT